MEISRGVRNMYGIPLLFSAVPSLTENTFAKGKPKVPARVEIVAIEVQSI